MTRAAIPPFSLLLLAGCASVDPRPSFDSVADIVTARSGVEAAWPRTATEEDAAEQAAERLLAGPLDDRAAAQIALLRNRELLAEIELLGIARADYAQATRIANPGLHAFRRTPNEGSGTNVEWSIVQDVLDVLVQPARKRLAAVELEAAKLRLGQTMLDLVAEARIAFFELVAGEETSDRAVIVHDLTAAAAELARRQRDAGNLEVREVALFEAADAQALVDLTRAQLDKGEARERLNVLLGLSGSATDWKASLHLPPLPAADPDPAGLERRAIEQRLDIGAARFGVDLVGRALALKRGTRFFPVGIEVGLNQEKDTDGTRLRGPQLAIALPIFDTGAASIARLEAEQRRAQRQLEQLAIEIRSEVRLARDRLIGARALVQVHEGTLLPKRREVLEQTLLHYNMMLLGVDDLLLARREETEAGQAATAARRDYWIARARLERAVGGDLANLAAPVVAPPGDGSPASTPDHTHPSTGGNR